MAYEVPVLTVTVPAGADLSGSQYRLVKLDANGNAILATAGDLCVGVLQNKPTLGQGATIMMDGITKFIAGAAVASGVGVQSDANGAGITLAGGQRLGICMEAASGANVIAEMLLTH